MIHLKSDSRYFEFIYNMAPNSWFVHNIYAECHKLPLFMLSVIAIEI